MSLALRAMIEAGSRALFLAHLSRALGLARGPLCLPSPDMIPH